MAEMAHSICDACRGEIYTDEAYLHSKTGDIFHFLCAPPVTRDECLFKTAPPKPRKPGTLSLYLLISGAVLVLWTLLAMLIKLIR